MNGLTQDTLRAHKRPKGQALLALLLLLLGLFLGLLSVVDLSRQAHRVTHIQQVTDNAAEAFAIIVARDLNFKSVTNRAAIANQIAIAQLVGLSSYLAMLNETSRNATLIVSWVPYVNVAMARLSQALQRLQRPFNQAVQGLIQAENMLVQLLANSQLLFHAAAAATALQTAQYIVEGTDNELELVLLNHSTLPDLAYSWLTYQQRSASATYFLPLLQQSRDGFSEARSYRWFGVGGALGATFDKWGGTEFRLTSARQLSVQAIDVATLRVRLGPFNRYTVPVASGAAHLGTRPPTAGYVVGDAFGGAYRARASYSRHAAARSRRLGLPLTMPILYRIHSHNDWPQITLVARRREAVDTLQPFAIARARVHYERPPQLWPRRDGRGERSHLLNALWQARLVPINIAEQWLLEQQV